MTKPRCLSVSAATGLLVLVSLPNLVGRAEAARFPATVTGVTGTCWMQPVGSAKWQSVRTGTTVNYGDKLCTGHGCRLEVRCADSSTFRFAENTSVDIREKTSGSWVEAVKVWSGSVWAKMTSLVSTGTKFEVQTPSATASIRGTTFAVYNEDGDTEDEDEGTEVTVEEGEVEVIDRAMEADAIEESPTNYQNKASEYRRLVRANQGVRVSGFPMREREMLRPIKAIAVMDLAAAPGIGRQRTRQIAEKITQLLRAVSKGRFSVIGPEEIGGLVDRWKREGRFAPHPAVLRFLAADSKVDALVVGRITLNGRGEVVTLSLLKADTGHALFARRFALATERRKLLDLGQKLNKIVAQMAGRVPTVTTILSVRDAEVTLAAGTAQGISRNARLLVLKKQAALRHPLTGEVLGPRVGGVLVVVRAERDRSIATLAKSSPGMTLEPGDLAVVRLQKRPAAIFRAITREQFAKRRDFWKRRPADRRTGGTSVQGGNRQRDRQR